MLTEELKRVHEDNRRAIFEFGNGGNWKVCKYLEIKEDCIVGDHYHRKKDECFLLLNGEADVTLSNEPSLHLIAPCIINVARGTYHLFDIKKGSKLICLASEEHDHKDDHKP